MSIRNIYEELRSIEKSSCKQNNALGKVRLVSTLKRILSSSSSESNCSNLAGAVLDVTLPPPLPFSWFTPFKFELKAAVLYEDAKCCEVPNPSFCFSLMENRIRLAYDTILYS